jgi:hypothetical protein
MPKSSIMKQLEFMKLHDDTNEKSDNNIDNNTNKLHN